MDHEAGAGAVIDEGDNHRFVVEQYGHVAELIYQIDGNRLILVHTGVPDAIGGKGIGGRLVRAAVARAAEQGLTVVPWCPYARQWLRAHPEEAASVTIDWKARPQ